MNRPRIGVLFICLGNICRSPLAEALFREAAEAAGLADRFTIDSAGTSGYHAGEPPDRRAAEVARRRGVVVEGSSRQVTAADPVEFDYLIVMDGENLRAVERLVTETASAGHAPRVARLLEFDPDVAGRLDVPDPYYGGPRGFEDVHDMVERATRGLLQHIQDAHEL